MDVDKLRPKCLEIVNTALDIQVVSVGIPILSIFSSMMEEDTSVLQFPMVEFICLPQTFNSVILSLISCQGKLVDRRLMHLARLF